MADRASHAKPLGTCQAVRDLRWHDNCFLVR